MNNGTFNELMQQGTVPTQTIDPSIIAALTTPQELSFNQ